MPKVINGIGRVFTIKEIMELLEVSDSTVRRYYRAGKLKGRKFGKTVFFTEASLKEFLDGEPAKAEKKKPVEKDKE
jgi:excisionase family DNA binding protein